MVDPNTVRRIARLADVGPDDHVVEIGAGLGSLTLALAETGADGASPSRSTAAWCPVLREEVAAPAATSAWSRATPSTLDWAAVLAGHDDWVLVANLPYNVATPLVLDLLDDVPAIAAHARDGAARGRRSGSAPSPRDAGLRRRHA